MQFPLLFFLDFLVSERHGFDKVEGEKATRAEKA